MVHVKSTSFTLLDYAHPERAPEGAGADGNGGGSHGSIVMVHVPLYRPNESLCRSIDVHTRFLEVRDRRNATTYAHFPSNKSL